MFILDLSLCLSHDISRITVVDVMEETSAYSLLCIVNQSASHAA